MYNGSVPTGATGASFAAWVRLNSPGTGTYQSIFNGRNGSINSCCNFRFLVDPNLHPFWDPGQQVDQNPTSYTFPLAQWFHIVWTVNASPPNAIVYVNGSFVAQSSSGIPATLPSLTNFEDATADSFQWPASGLFNDVLIYNRVLSASEVTSLYQAY